MIFMVAIEFFGLNLCVVHYLFVDFVKGARISNSRAYKIVGGTPPYKFVWALWEKICTAETRTKST